MEKQVYGSSFYENRDRKTAYAAERILQLVLDSCPDLSPVQSAVDVGCGTGTWLRQLSVLCGTEDIWGIDADYVNRDLLVIPPDHFIPRDLEERLPHTRRYDLAISMEVAEHLPASRADSFVEDLCALSDTVLFSAATVFQGGTHHLNEQRLSYWIAKFSEHGFEPFDIIRSQIWDDAGIPAWYRQNAVLFRKSPKERSEYRRVPDLIHPDIFEEKMRMMEHYARKPYFRMYFKLRGIVRRIRAGRTAPR